MRPRLPASLLCGLAAAACPITASAQRIAPPVAASRPAARDPAPTTRPTRVDHVRRRAIGDGISRGAAVGAIVGTVVGVTHAEMGDHGIMGSFTVMLWAIGSTTIGGVTGGIIAARRYDRAQGDRLTWR